jgi:hypothetical protein
VCSLSLYVIATISEDSVKVFVRIRPPGDGDDGSRSVEVDSGSKRVTMLCRPDPKTFTFDGVAPIDITLVCIVDCLV